MKSIVNALLIEVLSLALILPPAGRSAQAPGPQTSGAPRQEQPAPKQNPADKRPQESGATIALEVPVVTLDVIATTQHGDLLTGLKKENFRVLDNGVPQTITSFGATDAPITIVMLMEFSSLGYEWFAYQAKYWADAFFPNLKKDDWVALITFDLKPNLEVDFTQNKEEVREAVYHLYFPGFRESNVFDAVLDTVDRLKEVKGKKSILLMASGMDTFSKHTLDQTIKALRQSDVTIFSLGVAKPFSNWLEMRGAIGANLNLLQGENQLRTFSQLTGGYSWFPQFDGEIPGIFHDLTAYLRNQYSLSFTPTQANDGKFHKVKVELVAPDGSPLSVTDHKGKKQKLLVYAREGYTATSGGVGD